MTYDTSIIRPLEYKDAKNMLEWMHDSRVNIMFRHDFASMEEPQVRDFIANSFSDETKHFAIVDDSDEYLGTISLKNISTIDMNAEYAITTRTVCWGTGAAFKATMELLRYSFEDLNLHRVYLNVLANNKRAKHFYEKCGFKYEGCLKGHWLIREEYVDLDLYGINLSDWKEYGKTNHM